MGAPRVCALSASFGYLFGLTDERVLLVNDQTGATEELFAKRVCSSTEPPTATSLPRRRRC